MRLFQLDVDRARADFARQGYVHVRDGVTPEFLAHARSRSGSKSRIPQARLTIRGTTCSV